MTTTEHTPLANWERTFTSLDFIGGPDDADQASDPDYLAARLRYILDSADRYVAETDDGPPNLRGYLLAEHISRFAAELRVYGRAGTEMHDQLRRICPAVQWSRHNGEFRGSPSPWALVEPIETAAARLRLRPETPGCWRGVIEGWPVTLRAGAPGRVAQIRAELGEDTAAFLAEVGAGLPPIPWSRFGGALHGSPSDDDPATASQWAGALGLDDDYTDRGDGWSEYHGDTPIGEVRIGWISDPAAWSVSIAENRRLARALQEQAAR